MKWIEVGDIKNWVNGKQRHCTETLPELIRRLIWATATSIEEIDFPSGDSIATGGWDGLLKTAAIAPFFPGGVSGWEMGVENTPGKKAEGDYAKRTTNPLGLSPKETTFVFVTPRSWPSRRKWENEKRAAGDWKDVKVIGADALVEWLDSAPAVALWLARQTGKVISDGIRDIETVWEEWSLATNPKMSADVVTSGRTEEVKEIQQWIAQKPAILEIQGDSPDEALAFLYAAISSLPETERVKATSRCIVVENINDLRACTQAFQSPLITAASGECIEAAGAAVEKGHHVFVSMDAKVIDTERATRLSRPQRSVLEQSLLQSGLSEAEAQRLSRDFGRSIPVLRRHLFRSKIVSTPAWANTESTRLLLPFLFAGSWENERGGDRNVIEALSGMNYEAYAKELGGLLLIDDSPIRRIGNVWMLKSPLDAWFLLARHVNTDFLKFFHKSLQAVLTETDPKYDLPAEQRWAAVVYGKSSQYSEWMRSGLVESLVLLAVYGNRSSNVTSTQEFADGVVNEIFAAAQKWPAWASLEDVTPLLAEAAPDAFLRAVEQGIIKNQTLFEDLMRDGGDTIFGECNHSGLLWALESAAWSSEYFAHSVSVLAKLAKIDPGGRWANRPISSLRHIFLPGYPQTYATPEERLAALDNLIAKDPQLTWRVVKDYYRSGGSISESNRFRWRDSGGVRRGLEREDIENHKKYVDGLLPKLSDLACARENLVTSLDDVTRLPSDVRTRLIGLLETIDLTAFSQEERSKIVEHIRHALNWINSYGDEERRADVPGLNRVSEKFMPDDVIERVGWLLSNPWPRMPQGQRTIYEVGDTTVAKARDKAAREVLDKASLEKILDYAGTIQYVRFLGQALGKVVRDEKEDASVLDAMVGRTADNPGLIIGYAGGRVESIGPDWVIAQGERMKTKGNYSPEACALLYLGLPESAESWAAVSAHGEDVERAYWKRANGYSQTDRIGHSSIAIEKLLDAERPTAALQIAGDPKVSVSSSLLKRLLQEFLSLDVKKKEPYNSDMAAYHLGYVFNQLYERNELSVEEIAKLEFPFAPLFDDFKQYTSSPPAIHRILQKDPLIFAELVSYIYKRDDRLPNPSQEGMDQERIKTLAHISRDVLNSWRLLPGLKDDGSLDEKDLFDWIEKARRQCAESNHITGGDLQIAEMLSRAPADSDGAWPHTAVRNLIERLSNELIDRHIEIGLYNSRGVVSRGLTDGGRQERELFDKYKRMSETVRTKWPLTGAMLRSIASSYDRDAKREDISSELRDLRW